MMMKNLKKMMTIGLLSMGLLGCQSAQQDTSKTEETEALSVRDVNSDKHVIEQPEVESSALLQDEVVDVGGAAHKDSPQGLDSGFDPMTDSETDQDQAMFNELPEPEATVSPKPVRFKDGKEKFDAQNYKDAARDFDRFREEHPNNVWGHYMAGLSKWKAGWAGEAVESLNRALQLDPSYAKARINLARVMMDLDRNEEALPLVLQAVENAPEDGNARRVLGRCYHRLGQKENAIRVYLEALRIEPRDTWSMNNLGLLYIELGRYEEALPPLAQAVRTDPFQAVFQNNLGVALEKTGHTHAAQVAYRSALDADSTYAKAKVSLDRVIAYQDEEEKNFDLTTSGEQFLKMLHPSAADTLNLTVEDARLEN